MLELRITEMMKFPRSNASAESIHIVNTRVKLVNAEMNQVIGDTVSAFFARKIVSNWRILLENEIGVQNDTRIVRMTFGMSCVAREILIMKYNTEIRIDDVFILFKYLRTRKIKMYSCNRITGYSR